VGSQILCVFVIEERGDGEGVGSGVLCHIHNTRCSPPMLATDPWGIGTTSGSRMEILVSQARSDSRLYGMTLQPHSRKIEESKGAF
jgi:hypothetical protein